MRAEPVTYPIQHDRDYYLRLRRQYEPDNVKLIIVAEAPPASGKYFYDTTGSPKEWLFAAIMLQLGLSPATKEIGLQALKEKGWVLVDATYKHVDKLTKKDELDRDQIIARDYPLLVADLERLMTRRSAPTMILKSRRMSAVCLNHCYPNAGSMF